MKKLLMAATLLSLAACKVHVMNAELVSMTTKEPPKSKLQKGKEITEEWCISDDPIKAEPDRRYGLMDQVILKAQKVHKAKYFAETSFYTQGTCMTMTGTVLR